MPTDPIQFQRSTKTVDALLSAALRLYGERGIDAVSLREIGREAGQKNSAALQYHFKSKETLIAAVLARQMSAIDCKRLAYLDDLDARGELGDARSLVKAMIWPMAENLIASKQRPTALRYIGFLSELLRHPEYDLYELASETADFGLRRISLLFGKLLPHIPGAVMQQRFDCAIALTIDSLARIERKGMRRRRKRKPFDFEQNIENLVDMIAGAMVAEVSDIVASRADTA